MKHAFSRIRPKLIQLLAYVLCTLCKTEFIIIRTKGTNKCLCILDKIPDKFKDPATECGDPKGVGDEEIQH